MTETPKIRIVWIDDRERPSGKPEKLLDPDLACWFEVVHPSSSPHAVMSYESAPSFMQEFQRFWKKANDGKPLYFPAEIIVTDYNLNKSAAADRSDEEAPGSPGSLKQGTSAETSTKRTFGQVRDVNFDGLLIGTFYSTLTSRHPAAIVSITNYMGQMPSEVKTLHSLATPFLGVDFEHNLPSNERSWRNIVKEGVQHLRRRIEYLLKEGHISIPPSDIEGMIAGTDPMIITVQSPHALRKLPVEGLFIDCAEDLHKAAADWGRILIDNTVGYDVYVQGKELAQAVWKAYCDTDWVQERRNLSKVLSDLSNEELLAIIGDLQSGQCTNTTLADLWSKYKFEATQGAKSFRTTCNDSTCDFHSWGDFSKQSRRWAAILLVFWLFERILKKRIELAEEYRELMNREYHEDYPHITRDDVYLALFPVPKTPLVFPWDKGEAVNKDSTWAANLKTLKDDTTGASLALSVDDVLNGHDWSESGPHGLMTGERCMLQGLCRDSEVGEDAWRAFSAAARFIWGRRGQ